MAISRVQINTLNQNASASSTWSLAFNNPVGAGNSIVVFICKQSGGPTSINSVGDGSDTFVNVMNRLNSGDQSPSAVYFATQVAGGSTTVTVHWPSAAAGYMVIAEYSSGGLALDFDGFGAANEIQINTPSGTGTSGPTAFPYNPELGIFVAFCEVDNGTFSSPTSGYGLGANNTDGTDVCCFAYYDKVYTSATVEEASITTTPHLSSLYDYLHFAFRTLPPPAGSYSPAQQSIMELIFVTAQTFALAFTDNNTLNNSILVASITTNQPTSVPTDSQGNTYALVRQDHNAADGNWSSLWLAQNIKAGANTVTIHFGANTSQRGNLYIGEYPPILGSDKNAFATGNSTSWDSGASPTTTSASELIVGWGGGVNNDQDTYTPTNSFLADKVAPDQQFAKSMIFESKIVNAIGAYHATATVGTSGNWSMSVATFQMPATTDKSHNIDTYVSNFLTSKAHNLDTYIVTPGQLQHSIDAFITLGSPAHSIDAYIAPALGLTFARIAANIQFPINPNAYIKIAGTLLQPALQFVNLAGTLISINRVFVNLAGTIQAQARQYVKLAANISFAQPKSHGVDADIAVSTLGFVNLNGTIIAPLSKGYCGSFPDASYVKLQAWIVAPGDSIQLPGSGYTPADDFLSSQTALQSYKPISLFTLAGINLIITAFTPGVISWQTRTRSWLRRVDEAPNGILVTQTVNTHTLPNGAVITTTTTVTQNQDVLTTVTVIQNSSTPERTSTIITEKNKYGATTTREIDTVNINGNITTTEKKSVSSEPPTSDNIQPIKVTTLDGIQHYQFFDQPNSEWAGGDQEGLTTTVTQESTSAAAGQTGPGGFPLITKTTDQTVNTPDGKQIRTHTEITGVRDAGTTITDTTENFNGVQTVEHKVVTYPDGSMEVTDKTTNNTTGDSVEVSTETVTDEYGQVTTTVTTTETKTFVDPTTGNTRTTETKTVVVTKSGVSTTDTSVVTTNDFEDDIVNDKIQVFLIQEFTVNCVIDEMSMYALWEINETHQKNYALLELFGQQLGNATLSYKLRQNLIKQFNQANACVIPVQFQANGKIYQVVFAPSASAFRPKYIPGTEPHVYELQLILQARSNLITGTKGFF